MTIFIFLSSWVTAQQPANSISNDSVSSAGATQTIRPVSTDSPRDTLSTFFWLRDKLEVALLEYSRSSSVEGAQQVLLLQAQLRSLVDLSMVPSSSRVQVGNDTIGYLLDIFGRIDTLDLDFVPDDAAFEDDSLAQYRIPRTPIRIMRLDDGPREGEFLFNSRTVGIAQRVFRSVEHIPLSSDLEIASWAGLLPQLTGPYIPPSLVQAVPSQLRVLWLDTPIWKIIATFVIASIAALLAIMVGRWVSRVEAETEIRSLAWRLIRPFSILIITVVLIPVIDLQINTFGRFDGLVDLVAISLIYFASAWLFWLIIRLIFEWIILSPRISDQSLDANLLRLVGKSIGVLGFIAIMAYCGHELGLPVLSILAGLGIGGLGVALAIRPTLENLIGGVILYVDKPVRVGDFCSFGDRRGTVESIGVRSTQLRGVDRTILSVPNAQFADMEIINWAQCDKMLINEVIGVRYETTPDQLRFLLARLREMLHGHPRIDNDTIRVRFSGYGDSALNISIRVYADTREWNDYHAIREDIFLRINDLVAEAGTGFAFPSRTLYMGTDEGLDTESGQQAEAQVKEWRRKGSLPFPRYAPEWLARFNDSLDYPPKGSPEAGHEDIELATWTERLSAETSTDEDLVETSEDAEDANKQRKDKE